MQLLLPKIDKCVIIIQSIYTLYIITTYNNVYLPTYTHTSVTCFYNDITSPNISLAAVRILVSWCPQCTLLVSALLPSDTTFALQVVTLRPLYVRILFKSPNNNIYIYIYITW